MEPEVIRMFSSSPPPMDDPLDDDSDEFGDFGTFSSGVPNSVSFSEYETPTTFNQTQALNATSPPDIARPLISEGDVAKANGHAGKPLCNATNAETLTNGFQGSPPRSQHQDGFADFAAFSDKQTVIEDSGGTLDGTQSQNCVETENRTEPESAHDNSASFSEKHTNEDSEGILDDKQSVECQREFTDKSNPNRTEPEFADFNAFPDDCTLENDFTTGSETPGCGVSKDEDFVEFFVDKDSTPAQAAEDCGSLNGSACNSDSASESECVAAENSEKHAAANGMSERDRDGSSETETETSLGRPLSTDALEELGDMSTTGSVPSPPLQEETPTADDEDFGEFGDTHDFGNFEQNRPPPETDREEDDDDFGDFGDFNSPKFREERAEFPGSESFGHFSSAAEAEAEEEGWSAFGNDTRNEDEGESWATFGSDQVREEPSTTENTVSLSSRLEKLFLSSFPQTESESESAPGDGDVMNLRLLLEPGPPQTDTHSPLCVRVWAQLQDIHEALGLRYQWGGSYCNKTLLCCLGIDTRNILFTGQKKQPVIVPMYAAGLGMLEPVKPVSAAEMIASIGQHASCSSDPVQEALPPVQFDWSSSGLTNPLDASGGSSLLNLDFFGPVEDSESGAASIPGVDPELFELTTAKLDSNKVTDAFARLMSTVQSTSTSTRRPQREENLSEEAEKIISMFPDLSFMSAKVLMFPTSLTPHTTEPDQEPGLNRV